MRIPRSWLAGPSWQAGHRAPGIRIPASGFVAFVERESYSARADRRPRWRQLAPSRRPRAVGGGGTQYIHTHGAGGKRSDRTQILRRGIHSWRGVAVTEERRKNGRGATVAREREAHVAAPAARARYVMSDDTHPPRTCSAPPDATLETQAPRECERQKGRKFQGRSGRPATARAARGVGSPSRRGLVPKFETRGGAGAGVCRRQIQQVCGTGLVGVATSMHVHDNSPSKERAGVYKWGCVGDGNGSGGAGGGVMI